jgi:hypothetical protein
MVDHLTRVTVDCTSARAEDLARALIRAGFEITEEPTRLVADSATVEAREVKALLRTLGFSDREYRVLVEFVRRWGVM